MCVDICPVDVFEQDQATETAKVVRQDDCIGCLSCFYACPSQCVEVADVELMRPFHRIERDVSFVEKFLQEKSASTSLSQADFDEANADVAARLMALGDAVVETMGSGAQGGRDGRRGAVAASHMPEMYEEKGLDGIIQGMQRTFEGRVRI